MEREMQSLKKEIEEFNSNYILGRKKERAAQKRFIETKKLMFSVNSDFGACIQAILAGEPEARELVGTFLQENFYEQNSEIEAETSMRI